MWNRSPIGRSGASPPDGCVGLPERGSLLWRSQDMRPSLSFAAFDATPRFAVSAATSRRDVASSACVSANQRSVPETALANGAMCARYCTISARYRTITARWQAHIVSGGRYPLSPPCLRLQVVLFTGRYYCRSDPAYPALIPQSNVLLYVGT